MEGSSTVVVGHHAQSDEGLTLKATELRLGLPGTDHDMNIITSSASKNNKRLSPDESKDHRISSAKSILDHETAPPAPKAQIVGWPPVRSYRKNNIAGQDQKKSAESGGMYVKVSMDGAPYLRKIDLKLYSNGYPDLLKNLETMFSFTIGSEYATAYEDKDGDLMLLGDVPWDMFMSSCKRLRIMKGSDARGLGCSGL